MTSAYPASIGRRFRFMAGAISSPPGPQKAGTTADRLICSTRERDRS